MTIALGSKVKDMSTGFTGIATSRTLYFNGCVQYYIEAPVGKDGKIPAGVSIDEQYLKVLKGGICELSCEYVLPKTKLKSVGGPKRGNPRDQAKGA